MKILPRNRETATFRDVCSFPLVKSSFTFASALAEHLTAYTALRKAPIGSCCKVQFATLRAVAATLREVGVLGREQLELLARIVTENLLLGLGGAGLAGGDCRGRVRLGVVVAQNLDHGASAVPAIGRVIGIPEWVGGWERGVVESRVSLADALVAGGAVLQEVAVSVAHRVVPLDSHLRGAHGVVILRAEIVDVVLGINGADIARELLERLDLAVGIRESQADLREGVVGLETGEDEGVVTKRGGQFRRGLGGYRGIDCNIERAESLQDKAAHLRVGEHLGGKAVLLEDAASRTLKSRVVEREPSNIIPGERELLRAVEGIDGTVEEAVMFGFLFASIGAVLLIGGAIAPYSKKEPSPCCLAPVIGILYLSMKYCGSTSKYWRSIRSSSRCSAGE